MYRATTSCHTPHSSSKGTLHDNLKAAGTTICSEPNLLLPYTLHKSARLKKYRNVCVMFARLHSDKSEIFQGKICTKQELLTISQLIVFEEKMYPKFVLPM